MSLGALPAPAPRASAAPRRRRSAPWSERRFALALLAPALALMALTALYPVASSLWTSLHVLDLAKSLRA